MTTLAEIKSRLDAEKLRLNKKYGIVELGVFGSFVRGEQTPESDVDVLIGLQEPPYLSLFEIIRIENELSELLGVKVDLVIKSELKKRIAPYILKEVVPI